MRFGKTPIALQQLLHQKAQTIAAALGVTFITVLLFMQIGFRAGFLDTLTDLPASLDGDLFLLSSSYVTALRPPKFNHRGLHHALAFDEVESISPVYLSSATMKNPGGEHSFLRKIQVIGFPIGQHPILNLSGTPLSTEKLTQSRALFIDERSRKEFRPLLEKLKAGQNQSTEIRTPGGQHNISLVGTFPLGANTSTNSHMATSDLTFMELFARKREDINIGLIRLKPGANPEEVAKQLNEHLPKDVLVMEKNRLLAKERYHYEFHSPIGLIFRFGLGGAIVVGVVILYQILFQMLTKYLRDYATMKAIGFSQHMLRLIVLKEALILAIVGFLPGLAGSLYIYSFLTKATSLRFNMSAEVALGVLASICLICLISALLAIRKLSDADPADLFA
ncbi:MAG: FtsX-like permease family protein [Gammaproteobacteria bacterium]|nr:FtsX-like permease family protein [Gammaproteobacteria bacterium]